MCFFLYSAFVRADEGMLPINNSSDLKEWCKNKSAEHFIARDITPYNWSVSWQTKGNILHVKGHWKIDGIRQVVKCRILKGAERKYAVMEMPSQTLSAIVYDEENPINNCNELQEWCKNKSAQHLVSKDMTPYNWASSQWNKKNNLNVKGRWKANNSTYIIKCHIRKGVAEKYAVMEITKK